MLFHTKGDSFLRSDEQCVQANLSKHKRLAPPFYKAELSKGVRVVMAEFKSVFSSSENVAYQRSPVGTISRERYEYVLGLVKHVDELSSLLLY